ncbi:MAG: Xaa-Pro peptidase family protein [Thermodesulfobacteriota bacterium]
MMNPFRVPVSEIGTRRVNIQKKMKATGMDGILIIQRVDLFYFTGTSQNGFFFIPAEGAPLLMIKKYFPRAREESGISNIIEIKSVKEIPILIREACGFLPKILGLELDILPVREFDFYRNLMPATEYRDASPLILESRSIKSDWEIAQMEKAAEASGFTFNQMKSIIRPGLTEMEFAGLFEAFARKIGHGGMLRDRSFQSGGAYPWHVLSGKNGGMPGVLDASTSGEGTSPAFPSGAGYKKLKKNEPIMVDLGFVLNGYHMDETRMFAMGSMPKEAMKASLAVIEIHNAVLEKAKPGVATGELFQHSVDLAESMGYQEEYLGPSGYKVNFIGHGIGLELIEPPVIAKNKKDALMPGMTFALEPKMVFSDRFAAGIESVFQVTETGSRLISRVPVEIIIC